MINPTQAITEGDSILGKTDTELHGMTSVLMWSFIHQIFSEDAQSNPEAQKSQFQLWQMLRYFQGLDAEKQAASVDEMLFVTDELLDEISQWKKSLEKLKEDLKIDAK